MWPFKKKPSKPTVVRYGTTELQIGDACICVDDHPHEWTHQKLLMTGSRYTVRDVHCDRKGNESGYGGPFIRLVEVLPTDDVSWSCGRFRKAVKPPSIVEKVSRPADFDIVKERELADQLWKK